MRTLEAIDADIAAVKAALDRLRLERDRDLLASLDLQFRVGDTVKHRYHRPGERYVVTEIKASGNMAQIAGRRVKRDGSLEYNSCYLSVVSRGNNDFERLEGQETEATVARTAI